VISEVNVIIEI